MKKINKYARKNKENKKELTNAIVVGGLIGIGLRLLLTGIFNDDKNKLFKI